MTKNINTPPLGALQFKVRVSKDKDSLDVRSTLVLLPDLQAERRLSAFPRQI
jgi:hypothetical protein